MAAVLSLAACSKAPAPPIDTMPPPGLAERFYPPRGWAWSRLEVAGAPPLRYGVGSPTTAIRADILILPNAGEPVEAWFETANTLVSQGYNVWALDLAGQGGSGRFPLAEPWLHAPSLDPDVAAVKKLVAEVIRPRAPLIVLGEGLGGQIALRALEEGLPAAGAVLARPAVGLTPFPLPVSPGMGGKLGQGLNRIKLGFFPIPGKDQPESGDFQRERAAFAWTRSNPALAVGRPTWGWLAAYQASAMRARNAAAQERIKAPLTVLGDGPTVAACQAPGCEYVRLPPGPVQLGRDAVRKPWLDAVDRMIKARTDGLTVAAPPVAVKKPLPPQSGPNAKAAPRAKASALAT